MQFKTILFQGVFFPPQVIRANPGCADAALSRSGLDLAPMHSGDCSLSIFCLMFGATLISIILNFL